MRTACNGRLHQRRSLQTEDETGVGEQQGEEAEWPARGYRPLSVLLLLLLRVFISRRPDPTTHKPVRASLSCFAATTRNCRIWELERWEGHENGDPKKTKRKTTHAASAARRRCSDLYCCGAQGHRGWCSPRKKVPHRERTTREKTKKRFHSVCLEHRVFSGLARIKERATEAEKSPRDAWLRIVLVLSSTRPVRVDT